MSRINLVSAELSMKKVLYPQPDGSIVSCSHIAFASYELIQLPWLSLDNQRGLQQGNTCSCISELVVFNGFAVILHCLRHQIARICTFKRV